MEVGGCVCVQFQGQLFSFDNIGYLKKVGQPYLELCENSSDLVRVVFSLRDFFQTSNL